MLDRKKPQTVCTESRSASFVLSKILDQVIMDPKDAGQIILLNI